MYPGGTRIRLSGTTTVSDREIAALKLFPKLCSIRSGYPVLTPVPGGNTITNTHTTSTTSCLRFRNLCTRTSSLGAQASLREYAGTRVPGYPGTQVIGSRLSRESRRPLLGHWSSGKPLERTSSGNQVPGYASPGGIPEPSAQYRALQLLVLVPVPGYYHDS